MNRDYYAPRDGTSPPKPFTTDGCSGGMSFIWNTLIKPFTKTDIPWKDCCVEHDKEYWLGGSREERKEADRKLAECVKNRGYKIWSVLMYYGVRVGGMPYFPLSWRWGYGWKGSLKQTVQEFFRKN